MSQRLYRALQSLVLVLLGLFLFNRLIDGSLFWYINTRFLPLTLVGSIGLIWLARTLLVELQRESGEDGHGTADQTSPAHGHQRAQRYRPDGEHTAHNPPWPAHAHGRHSPAALLMLAIPVLLGVLVPARPLGASAIANKGLSTMAPLRVASADSPLQMELAPTERSVLDWLRAFNQVDDPSRYAGQPAELIGFVYHDPRLPAEQFLLGRFTLTCCVADAAAIGVIVNWPQAAELPTNGWVRVTGTVQVGQLDGSRIPLVLAASIEAVPQPAQPYLYN